MVRALVLGWLYLSSAQQPEPETASGCRDDSSWFARTAGTPCARIHWNRCATTRSDDGTTAARACAVTCGTCALLVGVENGTACADDDAWRATNGRSCQTIHVLTAAVPSYDRLEQCAALRSANRTAAQACPQACGACTIANAQPLQSTVATVGAPVPAPANSDDVVQSDPLSQSSSSVPTPADSDDTFQSGPASQSSALELPPDRVIVLRTPVGTRLPIYTSSWNLTGGAAFRTIDIATLGTFWAAQELETVLHIPSAGVASLVLPSDAFAASPGVFRVHGFVNIPHRADGVADTQDLIEVQLLPYNSTPTALSGAVLGTLRLHLSETASQLLDVSHDHGGADQMLHGEWREMQLQFQLVPEQLPGRFLIKLYGGRLMPFAFGGVRC